MKTNKYFIGFLVLAMPGLLLLLGWNCMQLYRFETKQKQEKVDAAVRSAATIVQDYNSILVSNFALMLTDKDFDQKLAFAAGFTRNMGKLVVEFDKADTPSRSNGDADLVINKDFLRKNKYTYKPEATKTVKHFDSLFQLELKKTGVFVPYRIKDFRLRDTTPVIGYVSQPFIVDFTNPRMYFINYDLPFGIIVAGIAPYIISSFLIYALLVAGLIFYYRGYQHQQRMARFKEVLFGNFAHELKTPVTSLQLIVDGAKNNTIDDDTAGISTQYLRFADSELTRMKLLIDKILSFSKMDRRQFEFNKEVVDIDSVIAEAIGVMRLNIERADAVVEYEAGHRITTIGDRTMLLNSVIALLDNALKYSGKPPMVTLTVSAEAGNALVAIKDNGHGIDSSYTKKIFEPFFRIPTGDIHDIPGHGLGLSFVADALKLHGSELRLTTGKNGTTFYFKLSIA